MPTSMTAEQILDREFLEIRSKILEVAAALDRLDRAEGTVGSDRRMGMIHKALQVLSSEPGESIDRAEEIQMIFSRPYNSNWRGDFQIAPARKAK
jgi:hypothetical protein